MDNKLYICRNCQYVFPKELSELIESKVQVYCEMCGTPFSLSGVYFKQASISESRQPIHKATKHGLVDKERSSLDKAIKILNKFDYVPMLIFSIATLILSFFNFITSGGIMLIINSYLIVFSSLLIIIYDSRFISQRIRSNSYNEITLDALCYGILGCVIYGTGVIILIKGILIFIYSAKDSERGDHKLYQFGLKLKNSINNFSAKAGFVILLLVLNGTYFSGIEISAITIITSFFNNFYLMLILMSFILISLIVLIIDLKLKTKIYNKIEFTGADVVRTFILGVLGTVFLNLGIFILLKSIILFTLLVGKPIDLNGKLMIIEPETKSVPVRKDIPEEPKEEQVKKEEIPLKKLEDIPPEPKIQVGKTEEKTSEEEMEEFKTVEEEHEKKIAEDVLPQKKQKDIKLRLHESLLPVKNEKDRKIVKEYFSKIFNIISKDLRKQIMELKIPKKERKNILKELAFLAEEEQLNYIEELRNLYEEIPKKLIERIRKLPNFKVKYFDKIIEELKQMDEEQRLEFLEFLEKHA
ncbi:MAG: hypothetical protein HWN80_00515 [Candidatus Lokiarchaeota archaeon]|nr:hypothetical protein [Candidatus Lokiarchaeota archaeon]